MAGKMRSIILVYAIFVAILTHVVISDDLDPIPEDKTKIEKWFQNNVQPLSNRGDSLNQDLMEAEKSPKLIKVSQDGKGDFKTVTDAVKSIPLNNKVRVIIEIAGGTYFEKIRVRPSYVTFYGDPSNPPTLEFNDNAHTVGSTHASASVAVRGHYFVASNIIFKNSAPMLPPGGVGAQAVALIIHGDMAALFSCKFYSFQDTLCDDYGRHFYKDCYIEGTVDFVWGYGRSLFLNTELHMVTAMANVVTASFREFPGQDQGFSFVHCMVTGTGFQNAFLGRGIKPYAEVIYSYTNISNCLNPLAWSVNEFPKFANTVFFREYKNTGSGAIEKGRAPFSKELSSVEANQYLNLGYIGGSKWLLPPPNL